MLIGSLSFSAMSENLAYLFPAQSGLNPPRPGSAAKRSKRKSMRLSLLNARTSTCSCESSFDGGNPKHNIGIVFAGMLPKVSKAFTKSSAYRDGTCLKSLGVQCLDFDPFVVDTIPSKFENFPGPHSGIDQTDQDRFQVRDASVTRGEQSILFFTGHNSCAFTFVGGGDERLTTTERRAGDPSFPFCDIEDPTKRSEFTVNAGNGSSVAPASFSQEPFDLVGFKFGVRDSGQSAFPEKLTQGFSVAAHGGFRAKAGDLSIINVSRGDGVALQVPVENDREFSVGTIPPGSDQRFSFTQGLTETVSGFGFGGTRTPERFTLSILHPRDAGIDSPVLNDDLDLMFAGHLYQVLHVRGSFCGAEKIRESQSDTGRVKNQDDLIGIDVLSCLEEDGDVRIYLTSNQKAAGSSPAGCIQFLKKSSQNQEITFSQDRASTQCSIRPFGGAHV